MPRRHNQHVEFDIHVDPSCLSDPMDESNWTRMSKEHANTDSESLYETVDWEEAHANLDLEEMPTSDGDRDEAGQRHTGDDIDALAAEVLAGLQNNDDSLLEEDASEVADSIHDDSQYNHDETTSMMSRQAYVEDEEDTNASESRRESIQSSTDVPERRTSGRTEALIHAAARDIVAHIQHGQERESLQSTAIAEEDSYISNSQPGSTRQSDAHTIADESHISVEEEDSYISNSPPGSTRQSDVHTIADESHISADEEESYISNSQPGSARHSDVHSVAGENHISADEEETVAAADDAGDSSSHHENENEIEDEDDVFSDHSPRSSVGSVSETEQRKMNEAVMQMMRPPRVSDVSQYDEDDDFVPTARDTPRPAFRSPSSVKAMQMSSPPASVFGSPRSSRRTPLPTVSRLGSPCVSAQFSPKKTPPRFKRSTPPLVLLHATLLPLRWPWGDVMDIAQKHDLSTEGKTLREAWRQLQDRVGDTVLERGILLPHPQNDYEVLEERMLEALELPMRRRARILECGHYLGAANEMTMAEDMDSEDEDYEDGSKSPRASMNRNTHWCSTCRSDIRYDSLGTGKVFRVKVYASNGLMKAGAWGACWKEMERVDIELEPIVEPAVQEELGRLAAEQERALELQEAEERLNEHHDEPEESFLEQEPEQHHSLPSSPVPEIRVDSSSVYDDRRRRDEERLREIYGHSPPTDLDPEPELEPEPTQPSASTYIPQETPASPSVEAFERREGRRHAKSASLPELLMEAVSVLMQDKKNVMIVLLSMLIMALAVRGGQPVHDPKTYQTIVHDADVPTVTVTQGFQETEAVAATMSLDDTPVVEEATASLDPCVSQSMSSGAGPQPSASGMHGEEAEVVSEIVRIVQTITETAVETATVRVTATETYTEVETEVADLEEAEPMEVFVEESQIVDEDESETTEVDDEEGEL